MVKAVVQSAVKKAVEAEPVQVEKVKDLLDQGGSIRAEVCVVLKAGLNSMKPIVLDGEIFMEIDYDVRRKYAETILEVIGERKQESSATLVQLTVAERGEISNRLDVMLKVLSARQS